MVCFFLLHWLKQKWCVFPSVFSQHMNSIYGENLPFVAKFLESWHKSRSGYSECMSIHPVFVVLMEQVACFYATYADQLKRKAVLCDPMRFISVQTNWGHCRVLLMKPAPVLPFSVTAITSVILACWGDYLMIISDLLWAVSTLFESEEYLSPCSRSPVRGHSLSLSFLRLLLLYSLWMKQTFAINLNIPIYSCYCDADHWFL